MCSDGLRTNRSNLNGEGHGSHPHTRRVEDASTGLTRRTWPGDYLISELGQDARGNARELPVGGPGHSRTTQLDRDPLPHHRIDSCAVIRIMQSERRRDRRLGWCARRLTSAGGQKQAGK